MNILLLSIIYYLVPNADAIWFKLKMGERKCLRSKAIAGVLVKGSYDILKGQGAHLYVNDEFGQLLFQKQFATKGFFTFTLNQPAKFDVCFHSEVTQYNIPHAVEQEVNLQISKGSEAKNYDDLAEAEKLRPLELMVKRLEDMSNDIVTSFELLQFKDGMIRQTYSSVSSNVLYLSAFCMHRSGLVHINVHHIIFSDQTERWLPIKSIISISCDNQKTGDVNILTGNLEAIRFTVDNIKVTHFIKSIRSILVSDEEITLIPFHHDNLSNSEYHILSNTNRPWWHELDIVREFYDHVDQTIWKISKVNSNYRVCNTYPSLTVIACDDNVCLNASQARLNRQYPILAYYHETSKAALVRAGKLITNVLNKYDEAIFENMRSIKGERSLIFYPENENRNYEDRNRSRIMKMFRNEKPLTEETYGMWKRMYCTHCPTIESVSQTLCTLLQVIINESAKYSAVAAWLTLLSNVLMISSDVCTALSSIGTNVCMMFEHDMSLILSILVQIQLKKDYRTLIGFQKLLIRELVLSGFRFSNNDSRACLILFLDCLYQLMCRNPYSFQFNEQFLLNFLDHMTCSKHGTFLYDNERQRNEHDVYQRCSSLWSEFDKTDEKGQKFINPLFNYQSCRHNDLHILHIPNEMVLWKKMPIKNTIEYLVRYDKSMKARKHSRICDMP
ncbi:hypothetical protein GJ496_001626 [Pomphorhynchus laevis]|nr:hypothetical protein GJ496_001626 [Pomphorhynchus laevis]